MIVMRGFRQRSIATIGTILFVLAPIKAATIPASPTSSPSSKHTEPRAALSPSGYAGIRIGARPQALHGYTFTNARSRREECYVTGVKEVPGLALLVTSGTIKRISIGEHGTSTVKTDRGIGIGSTEAVVRRVYRPLQDTPHQYVDAPAAYLTWLDAGRKRGVRFETGTDRRVKVIHVGLMPELGYVERCG